MMLGTRTLGRIRSATRLYGGEIERLNRHGFASDQSRFQLALPPTRGGMNSLRVFSTIALYAG